MEKQSNNLEVLNDQESLNVENSQNTDFVESETLDVEQEDTLFVDSIATDVNDIFKSMGKRQ